jgi:hypothetical protein
MSLGFLSSPKFPKNYEGSDFGFFTTFQKKIIFAKLGKATKLNFNELV